MEISEFGPNYVENHPKLLKNINYNKFQEYNEDF